MERYHCGHLAVYLIGSLAIINGVIGLAGLPRRRLGSRDPGDSKHRLRPHRGAPPPDGLGGYAVGVGCFDTAGEHRRYRNVIPPAGFESDRRDDLSFREAVKAYTTKVQAVKVL